MKYIKKISPIRIVVIDSGISRNGSYLKHCIIKKIGIKFDENGNLIEIPNPKIKSEHQ